MNDVRILLVDDDREFLGLLVKKIESWGYQAVPCSSGAEALEVIKSNGADMVILDYMMPDMDGIETLKEVRRIDKKIQIIMFTSMPDKRSIEGTEKLGIFAYIPKVGVFTDPESSLRTAIGMAEKKLLKGDSDGKKECASN